MDYSADQWQVRLKKQLKDDNINLRDLSRLINIGYSTLQNHLDINNPRRTSIELIRDICRVRKYSMIWILFGVDDENQYQMSTPWLTKSGVKQWLKSKTSTESRHIINWFNYPTVLDRISDRSFVWQVKSNEVEDCGWPARSWLYIDPDEEVIKRESRGLSAYQTQNAPLCLVRLKETDGLMVCRLETVANQIWVLPGNKVYPVYKLDDVDVIGKVIAGMRMQKELE